MKDATRHIAPKAVLKGATDAKLKDVLVIGYEKNGYLYAASSLGEVDRLLQMLERTKEFIKRNAVAA